VNVDVNVSFRMSASEVAAVDGNATASAEASGSPRIIDDDSARGSAGDVNF
jgi:hypothetical protein